MKRTGLVFALAALLALPTFSFCRAMPAVSRGELANHLKLLVFQDHSIPAVTMELLVAAGSSFDPPATGGLANITASSLSLGTRYFSFDQINSKLDFIGATYGVDCTRDFVTIDMQVLKKNLDEAIGLFAEIIEHPAFPDDELDQEKDEMIGRLREDEDNPSRLANRIFDKAVFRNSLYAGSVRGGVQSVAAISRAQILKFYDSYYRPNNAVLVIGGDITPEEVRARVIPKLLEWNAGPIAKKPLKAPGTKGATRFVADRPVSRATIIVGGCATPRSGPDYYPFLVLNRILGAGDFPGRLREKIGTGKGAVSVRSGLEAYEHAGAFRVVLRTENGSAKEAAALVQKEFRRLGSETVSNEELKAAKEFLKGEYALQYGLAGNFAKWLAEARFYRLGPDDIAKYPDLIDAVSAEDIQRAALKYLSTRNVVVIVADLKKAKKGGKNGPAPARSPKRPKSS